ncbi:MAG: helix-turn-helix domain-containing protein [Bacillota bacterium]|nr:helix-turn-helix domain-containing protein [Bacillota bacterium]
MNNIKKLRNAEGITSKELAERTGIPYDTLKNYEYDRREPTGKYLVALEKYFNKTGEYILGLTNDDQNIYAHFDEEIMNAIDENWATLFNKIIFSIKNNDSLTQKLFFNIMVEIKAILNSKNMTDYQKSVSISLIHDVITGLLLSVDRAVVNLNENSIEIDRINNYKQKRIEEYTRLLDDFFSDFHS